MAALLIWVMTHEIISSKRSVANDYFLFIDWDPTIFLMLSVSRKLCPGDIVKKNKSQRKGCWMPSSETNQTLWQQKASSSHLPSCPLHHPMLQYSFFHLWFASPMVGVNQCCTALSFVHGFHAAGRVSRISREKQVTVCGTDDRKTWPCQVIQPLSELAQLGGADHPVAGLGTGICRLCYPQLGGSLTPWAAPLATFAL